MKNICKNLCIILLFSIFLSPKIQANSIQDTQIAITQLNLALEAIRHSNIKPLTENNVANFIYSLKDEYPEGMKWAMEKSHLSLPLYAEGHGCSAFGLELSDKIFGNIQEQKVHYEYEKIRIGDLVEYDNKDGTWHMVIPIKKDTNGITVVEGNNNGRIRWERYIRKDFLESHSLRVHTRWPNWDKL